MTKSNEIESLKIKLLSVTAAINILAGGITLMYTNKKDNNTNMINQQDVQSNYEIAKEFWDKMPHSTTQDDRLIDQVQGAPYKPISNDEYIVDTNSKSNYEIAKEFWDKMPHSTTQDDRLVNQVQGAPYKPISNDEYIVDTNSKSNYEMAKEFWDKMPHSTTQDNRLVDQVQGAPYKPISNENETPLPTKGVPYEPGTIDYSVTPKQDNNPLTMQERVNNIRNGISSNENEKQKQDLKPIPTMGAPYEPGTIDYNAMPIPRGTPILAEMYKINPKLAKTDSVRDKAQYMDETHKQQLYEMDPRLDPNNKPPYKTGVENENTEGSIVK